LTNCVYSAKSTARIESKDIFTIKEKLRARKRRQISGFAHCASHSKSHGIGRGESIKFLFINKRANRQQREEVASHLEEATEVQEGAFPNDEKTQKYGNLLFLLQSEPRHIAHLCRLVSMAEIDSLLQTVMFTIYGNQYESREEHLLLTMFQVRFLSSLLNLN
jgi:Ras GTPase-activating-like protein IQGAP2/3